MIPSSGNPGNPSVGIDEGVCGCCRYWGGPRVLEVYQWRCIPSPDGSCVGPCMRLGLHASRSYYSTCTDYVECSSTSGCGMWNKADGVDAQTLRREMEGRIRAEVEEEFRKSRKQDESWFSVTRDKEEGEVEDVPQGDISPSDLPLSDLTMPMPCRGSVCASYPSQGSSTTGSEAVPLTDPLFKKMIWGLAIAMFLAYVVSTCRG
jgi:hypothetical protein